MFQAEGVAISGSGQFVAYALRSDPMNPASTVAIYLTDTLFDQTFLASTSIDGTAQNGHSKSPRLSTDGKAVAFYSESWNLFGRNQPIDFRKPGLYVSSGAFIEKVQPVQAVINTTPRTLGQEGFSLVAEKDLLVRVYVRHLPGVSGEPVSVFGDLCIDGGDDCPGNQIVSATGSSQPVGTEFTDEEKHRGEDSLNFFITGADADRLLLPGAHRFTVKVFPADAGTFMPTVFASFDAGCRGNSHVEISTVRATFVGNDGQLLEPPPVIAEDVGKLLRHAWPLEERTVNTKMLERVLVINNAVPLITPGERGGLVLLLARLRNSLIAGNFFYIPTLEVLHAVVPPTVGGVEPFGPGVGGYTIRMAEGVVVTTNRLLGVVTAHEIGHQVGFGEEYCRAADFPCAVGEQGYEEANPPPANAEQGDFRGHYIDPAEGAFDVGGYFTPPHTALFTSPLSPALRGFMGNGNPIRWVRQSNYEFLYQKLTNSMDDLGPGGGGGGGGVDGAEPHEVINITGVVTREGVLTLDPLVIATTSLRTFPPRGTTYTVEFRDGVGALLGSFGFDPDFRLEVFLEDAVEVEETDEAVFSYTVELPEGTQSVALLDGLDLVTEVLRSPAPPRVSVTSAAADVRTLALEWSGEDPDGDPLTYMVYYSPDGESFESLAVHTSATSSSFELEEAPGPGAMVKVRASDGFHSASATAGVLLAGGGRQVPGDCNQDALVDISDMICLLGFLFAGQPPALPCGDGLPGDPANRTAFDWQADGGVDLSDAIAGLQFLFSTGAPHARAIPGEVSGCVSIQGCPDTPGCP